MFYFKKIMERILICHRGALGDFILTWNALRMLRNAYPGCRITALGRPEYLELAAEFGLVDERHDAESSTLVPFFAGTHLPPVLSGFTRAYLWLADGAGARQQLETAGTHTAVFPPFPRQGTEHVGAYHMRTMTEALGTAPEPPAFHASGPVAVPAPILIHPGSGSTAKNYAPYLYVELAAALAESYPDYGVQIVLGPAEQGLVRSFTGPGLQVVRPRSVRELAGHIRGAALFIGNDSGPSHLAGFMGVPTIALYRTTAPSVWGVTGPRVRNLTCKTEDAALEKVDLAVKELLNCA